MSSQLQKKGIPSAPQPGRPECGEPSFTTVRQHQHFLGTTLWGRTTGEKQRETSWPVVVLWLDVHQGYMGGLFKPRLLRVSAPQFLIPLVLGWGPKPCIPTSPQVLLLLLLLWPIRGAHCENHGLRGLSPTPEGSQLWGPFLRCPLKHRDPTTVPCPPPAPWPSPTCAFLNRVRKHREGKSVESLFDTDLLTRRLNHGSLARNPFEVLCAGTRGKLCDSILFCKWGGVGWGGVGDKPRSNRSYKTEKSGQAWDL